MNRIILLLAFLMTMLYACKKKIPHDAVVNKMAGKHEWRGIEMTRPSHSAIWDVDSLKFSTVIYAVNENTIMYYDSAYSRMMYFYFYRHDTSNKSVHFNENQVSSYNVIQYYYLIDSFFWERHLIGWDTKWILHSP